MLADAALAEASTIVAAPGRRRRAVVARITRETVCAAATAAFCDTPTPTAALGCLVALLAKLPVHHTVAAPHLACARPGTTFTERLSAHPATFNCAVRVAAVAPTGASIVACLASLNDSVAATALDGAQASRSRCASIEKIANVQVVVEGALVIVSHQPARVEGVQATKIVAHLVCKGAPEGLAVGRHCDRAVANRVVRAAHSRVRLGSAVSILDDAKVAHGQAGIKLLFTGQTRSERPHAAI